MKPFGWITKAWIVVITMATTSVQVACYDPALNWKADEGKIYTRVQFPMESHLKEGQIAKVSGTDLAIEVRKVSDFTSEGCLGGPPGCPDQVQLRVTQGKESKELILYVAHTQSQRDQGVNQVKIFGHKIVLTALQGKQITLSIN